MVREQCKIHHKNVILFYFQKKKKTVSIEARKDLKKKMQAAPPHSLSLCSKASKTIRMLEFTLQVNRKHTDPERSNLPVKKKKKTRCWWRTKGGEEKIRKRSTSQPDSMMEAMRVKKLVYSLAPLIFTTKL